MGKTLLIELHHLPLVSYFSLLTQYETVLIEAYENFQKQSLRNRTYILSANGELLLTVPIQHGAATIQDVRIDYSQPWLKNHIRGITSAYKHSPYFDYYFPYFEDIYSTKPAFLFDLNMQFLELLLKVMKLPISLSHTSTFEETYSTEIIDVRSKNQYRENVKGKPYQQVFGNQFMGNLSVIDLIFNMGPDSTVFL